MLSRIYSTGRLPIQLFVSPINSFYSYLTRENNRRFTRNKRVTCNRSISRSTIDDFDPFTKSVPVLFKVGEKTWRIGKRLPRNTGRIDIIGRTYATLPCGSSGQRSHPCFSFAAESWGTRRKAIFIGLEWLLSIDQLGYLYLSLRIR